MVRNVTNPVVKDGMFGLPFPKSHMNPVKKAGDSLSIVWPVGNNSPSEAGQAQVSVSIINIVAANEAGGGLGPITTVPANTPSRDVAVSIIIPLSTPAGTYFGIAFLRGTNPGSTLSDDHRFTLTLSAVGPDLFVVGTPTIG